MVDRISAAGLHRPRARARRARGIARPTPAADGRGSSSSPANRGSESRGCWASSSAAPWASAPARSAASASSSARTSFPIAPLVGAVRPLARADDPAFDAAARVRPRRAGPARARARLARPRATRGPRGRVAAAAVRRPAVAAREARRRRRRRLLARGHPLGRPLDPRLPRLPERNIRDERVLVVSPPTARTSSTAATRCARCSPSSSGGRARDGWNCRRSTAASSSAQLADILGSSPSDEVVDRLFARSEGNPLFTEELLAGGLDGQRAAAADSARGASHPPRATLARGTADPRPARGCGPGRRRDPDRRGVAGGVRAPRGAPRGDGHRI